MSAQDDLRRLTEQVRRLEREVTDIKAATGKIPTRMAKTSGGGTGGHAVWVRTSYHFLSLIAEAIDGDVGYASVKGHSYVKRNGVWRINGYFEFTTLAGFPTPSTDGVEIGDEAQNINTGLKYYYGEDAEWHCFTHFVAPA